MVAQTADTFTLASFQDVTVSQYTLRLMRAQACLSEWASTDRAWLQTIVNGFTGRSKWLPRQSNIPHIHLSYMPLNSGERLELRRVDQTTKREEDLPL